MKNYIHTRVAFALLLLAIAGCSGYEDGPAMSLRSKHARMSFTRPITWYTVQGVDSLAGLMDIIRAECHGFRSNFRFQYDPEEDTQFIVWSDSSMQFGSWADNGDLKAISVNLLGGRPFPICCWDILRLTNRQLWLRSVKSGITRELRFEE